MPTSDYTPIVADVGSLLRARTKSTSGSELGTFDATTRPTGDEVTALIAQAAGTVSLMIGDDIPAALFEEAKRVVALGTAMLIELSYFPEQVATDRSPYAQYKELYDEAIGTPRMVGKLVAAIDNAKLDQTVDAGGPRAPRWAFPKLPSLRW